MRILQEYFERTGLTVLKINVSKHWYYYVPKGYTFSDAELLEIKRDFLDKLEQYIKDEREIMSIPSVVEVKEASDEA